jgi:hypothetical protein
LKINNFSNWVITVARSLLGGRRVKEFCLGKELWRRDVRVEHTNP